jgi:hypothetical protein
MLRAYLAVVAALAGACSSSSSSPRGLSIVTIAPPCPAAGGLINLTLAGGDVRGCDSGRIYAADRELLNLGLVTGTPLVLSARLPAGFALLEGMEVKVACGNATASTRWFGTCPAAGDQLDAATDAELPPDASSACGMPIEPVIEAVDHDGRSFPRDAEGVFLVPLDASDFAFDTLKTRNVTGRDMTYTFTSDCFPKVAVKSPVLVGLSVQGLWLGRRCQFKVEILDRGCTEPRSARAEGTLEIVPPP